MRYVAAAHPERDREESVGMRSARRYNGRRHAGDE